MPRHCIDLVILVRRKRHRAASRTASWLFAKPLELRRPDVECAGGAFRTASDTLTPEAREKPTRVGGILGAHPDLHMTVEGHTDDVGNEQSTQELSVKRAQAMFVYLVLQKIPLTAIDTAGFGETRPAASNDTECEMPKPV
jgi:flagellar motor protein MotB